MKKNNILILLAGVAIVGVVYFGIKAVVKNIVVKESNKKIEIYNKAHNIKPSMVFAKNPIVVLKTNEGDITLELYPKYAPLAVENFVTHVKNGYYDGIIFHRVIKGFMIQGGDPTGTGMGGKSIWGVPFVNEFYQDVVFDKEGILAMANAGENTNASQFFITTAQTLWLNGGYTIFGQVVSGMDVVKKIENTKVDKNTNRPLKDEKIVKAFVKK